MGAPLCHFELMSNDPARCKRFYGDLFGWEFDDTSMPEYTMINTGSEPGGGLMQRPEQAPCPALNVYFMVEDIDATLTKAGVAGAQVCVPKTPIPGTGWFAMILDPEGIPVGLFQTL